MTRRRTCVLAALVVLTIGVAGCGGDDDDGAAEATPATPATTAAKAAPNERLDQESWDEYVAARDSAKEVNDKAVTTFRGCRNLLGTGADAEKVQTCLGDSASSVVDEGQKLRAVLGGFSTEVGGACADALEQLDGNVKLYISSVNAIALGIEHADLPTPQAVGNSTAQLARTQAEAAKFDAACKPV
jgi:hypothetical protein